jgi:iron(II)-dependent oxidoreductase
MRGKAPGIVCNEINYDYLISKYPITICQFQNFIENNHNYFPKDPSIKYKIKNHPVTSVCWQDCLSFCEWLTLKWQAEYNLPNSWIVRIPTENEWEKAVRGGIHLPSHPIEFEISDKFWLSTGDFILSTNPNPIREFPYGKKAETDYIDKNIVNYSMSGISNTNALGCFPMNISPYGVAEMSGNVWEWTLDSNPYEKGDKRFSIGNAPKAVRGGSFFFEEKYSKSYERGKKEAKIWAGDVGFRLVVSLSFSELEDQVQGGGRC